MATETMQYLIIRADASTQMGTGHVMRCLAIAQAWQDSDGTGMLAAATLPPALHERLRAEAVDVRLIDAEPGSPADAAQTATIARAYRAAWVVVDGYQFGSSYQRALKDAGLQVLFIDDYGHADRYDADLIFNQNIYANKSLYTNRASNTKLLLGARYALLRREFWPWRGWRREIAPVVRKVLVTLGGSDPPNVTIKVIQALELLDLPELEIVIVAGSGNLHYEDQQTAVNNSRHTMRIRHDVTDMSGFMAWADIAISAGGSTTYELARMGLPTLYILLAENQHASATALAMAGVGICLGWYSQLTAETIAGAICSLLANADVRHKLTHSSQDLIDGYGANRVIAKLCREPITLRQATTEDCYLIWNWANEPTTRAASFSSASIPWEEHMAWFAQRIASQEHRIWIGVDAKATPIGQVRFERKHHEAVISVGIAQHARGQGYGSTIIRLGAEAVFAEWPIRQIIAYLKPDNQISLRAFLDAGFVERSPSNVHGVHALCLILMRKEDVA
ncbi:UDP-2,4-diacetamido-2,4,6-trideoxy-beta-L-altropyranose hydrolase [Candidatus Chloroploca sp. Khr17]|uniref:UDP-2,4-diacetamido-2,4, 6-trideoxy-beta-L-altropyranose hydrolase n=1 Tax=Candidatus Chloroploca sp. Khr17 TaxID=2496869 RepID=UPI0013ECBE39|nr:UDP-2,4-diacetamido-2,4,6-trideoxy-beta-L-altropyranose hydrolase [Candidatus Chloroploca sp. Khr17]